MKRGTENNKRYVENWGSVKTLKFSRRKQPLAPNVRFRKRQQTRIEKMSSSENAETVEGAVPGSNKTETAEGAVSAKIDSSSSNRNQGEDNIYSVTFESNTLGLIFNAHHDPSSTTIHPTYIKEITKDDHRNKMSIGDELIAVGNTRTGNNSLVVNTELIRRTTKRPLTLQFRKKNSVLV